MIRGLMVAVLVLCVCGAADAQRGQATQGVDLAQKWAQHPDMVAAREKAQLVLQVWRTAIRELEVRADVVARGLADQIQQVAVALENAENAAKAKARAKAAIDPKPLPAPEKVGK